MKVQAMAVWACDGTLVRLEEVSRMPIFYRMPCPTTLQTLRPLGTTLKGTFAT